MSQYQPPYQPGYSNYSPAPPPDVTLRAPARRASVVLLILGGLALLCGTCFVATAMLGPMAQAQQTLEQSGMQVPKFEGWTAEQTLRGLSAIQGGGCLLAGLVAVVLGMLVRRGRIGWVVCSLIFSGLIGLYLLLNAAQALLAVGQSPLYAVLGFLLLSVPMLLTGMALFWLAQAARNSSRLLQHEQLLQSQLWQHQQQQAAFGGYGYGYGAPTPPAGQPAVAPPPAQLAPPGTPPQGDAPLTRE